MTLHPSLNLYPPLTLPLTLFRTLALPLILIQSPVRAPPQVCVVYCLDSQFVTDTPKFIAGCLQVLAAMAQLEAPHVSVLTKVDLIQDKVRWETQRPPVTASITRTKMNVMQDKASRGWMVLSSVARAVAQAQAWCSKLLTSAPEHRHTATPANTLPEALHIWFAQKGCRAVTRGLPALSPHLQSRCALLSPSACWRFSHSPSPSALRVAVGAGGAAGAGPGRPDEHAQRPDRAPLPAPEQGDGRPAGRLQVIQVIMYNLQVLQAHKRCCS